MRSKDKKQLQKYYVFGLPMLGFTASVVLVSSIIIIGYKFLF